MKTVLSIYYSFGRRFYLCTLLALFCVSGFFSEGRAQRVASPVEVHATIDTQQMKIGEQFHLYLQAVTDSGQAGIGWAQVPDSFNHLMVVSRSPVDTVKNKGQVVYQQKYTLTGFDSGRWTIPSFQFHPLKMEDSAALAHFRTDSLSILIHTVAVDTTKPFEPIKEIRTVPFNILDYWPYLAAAIVGVLLVLLILFLVKRKKHKAEGAPPVPQESPYEQAVKRLSELEKKKLWEKGEIKAYYSDLTDILRLYIQRQYGVNALEQTTDELLEKVKKITRLNQQREGLKYILETADLAKFAKLLPSDEEHKGCMKKARDFVEWTKPQPAKEEDKIDDK